MKVLNLNHLSSIRITINYLEICSVFRILVTTLAIIDFTSILFDFNAFFSSKAILPIQLGIIDTEYFKYLNPLYDFLNIYNVSITSFFTIISIIYLLILFLCLIGLFSRVSFIVAIILQLIIFRSIPNYNYGYDNFLTISFFYCILFPVGKKFTLFKTNISQPTGVKYKYFNLITFLRTHLCVTYFLSGIAKSVDINWWNGNAIWRAIATTKDSIYIWPYAFAILSILVVISELLYSLIIQTKYRKYIIYNIILMHLGIALFLGLSSFASILIIWNITAFYKDFVSNV